MLYIIVFIILFPILIFIVLLFQRHYFGGKYHHIEVDSSQRSYKVHLPKSYKENNNYPLIIALHGLSENPFLYELNTGFSKKADEEKFIVVYPAGTGSKLSWNAQFCCGDARAKNIDDVKFIQKMLEELQKNYSINPEKIFITGFSNGGMMSYYLASQLKNIRSIGVVSATIGSETNQLKPPTNKIPLIAFHGEEDKSVLLNGGGEFNFLSTEESLKKYIGTDFIQNTQNSEDFIKTSYTKENNTIAILYVLKNKGHVWPGSLLDYFLNRKKPSVYATEAIWDYFNNLK